MSESPLVSVVTPFYNTATFLRECIESVLAQTYVRFEYLLVDNHSTDGSAGIAAEYAKRDARIRLVRNPTFVAQVPNYNGAVRHVAPDAKYVKVVQADDMIFPGCLERMVQVGESHPTAAIITSYRLRGKEICGTGVEWPNECIPGRDAGRLHLLDGRFLFGSPSTVMYRASLLAKRQPFYSESSVHEDTELCFEALTDSDLGFVHQVLSFSRVGNAGNLTTIESFFWAVLDSYLSLRKYGPLFLSENEYRDRMASLRAEYLRVLGESLVLGRDKEFWDYHRHGLATVDEQLPSSWVLAPKIARAALKAVVRPRWFLRERARFKSVEARAGRASELKRGIA
jgi:glycosyltransferase involved in cell wall biosynthesis